MYRLKRTIGLIGCSMLLLWVLASCGNTDSNKGPVETSTKGNITIAIDPSFKPVLEQQLKVFDSSYPEAHVKGIYLNEADCFTRLFQDSVRLIMVSRDVTAAEKEAYKKREIKVKSLAVAMDAIAVIVNKKSVDSLMTMGQLKQIFLGGFARKYTIVFDKEEESILRYLADSLIPGQPLPSNIYGVANSDSLIAYVSKNENAIGFLGVTHVYDPESTVPEGSFKKEVNVVAMNNENDTLATDFYQPYQAYIALKQYPLYRNMYFVTVDNWNGLAAGFANYLSREQGQLLFKKARLVPLRVQLTLRPAEIK